MSLRQTVAKTLTANSANNICLSQSTAGAANFVINGAAAAGGVATLDTQRRVLITSAGNDSGISFTITGTIDSGQTVQETVTGANTSTASSTQDFKTITKVHASGATAAGVTVGTNTVGSSPWQKLNEHVTPVNAEFSVTVSGTVNYTVEWTVEDLEPALPTFSTGASFGPLGPIPPIPTAVAHASLQGLTVAQQGSITFPASAWRITVNSGTGTVTVTAIQAGIRQ